MRQCERPFKKLWVLPPPRNSLFYYRNNTIIEVPLHRTLFKSLLFKIFKSWFCTRFSIETTISEVHFFDGHTQEKLVHEDFTVVHSSLAILFLWYVKIEIYRLLYSLPALVLSLKSKSSHNQIPIFTTTNYFSLFIKIFKQAFSKAKHVLCPNQDGSFLLLLLYVFKKY